MKVKTFVAPRVMMATLAQMRNVLRGCGQVLARSKALTAITVLGTVLLVILMWPHDAAWLSALHIWKGEDDAAPHRLAYFLGTYGDYLTYNVPLALALWCYGFTTKSSFWRRVAVIAFLGATLAGLFDDCFRLTLGRARPDAHLPDQFYGIRYALSGGYQSFPSGHSASTFGTAVALLLTEWRWGLVATVIALSVAWARMELSRHYPSDVAVGALIGIYFGFLVGCGARWRHTRRRSTGKPVHSTVTMK